MRVHKFLHTYTYVDRTGNTSYSESGLSRVGTMRINHVIFNVLGRVFKSGYGHKHKELSVMI